MTSEYIRKAGEELRDWYSPKPLPSGEHVDLIEEAGNLDIFMSLPEEHRRQVAEAWDALEKLAALPCAPPGIHGLSQDLLDVYGIRYSDLLTIPVASEIARRVAAEVVMRGNQGADEPKGVIRERV